MMNKLLFLPDNLAHSVAPQEIAALFLGCQVNPNLWVPVKKMIGNECGYRTGYVNGVKQAMADSRLWQNFFDLSPLDKIKITRDIHPDYACRMPLDRPQEMSEHLPNLGLPADLLDPIAYVARSGGYRQTDSLDVFPEVQPDSDGCYRFFFGLRGLHLLPNYQSVMDLVKPGDLLIDRDGQAIHQKIEHPLGSLPGYIHALATDYPEKVQIEIERVNQDAFYTNDRLLCSATCKDFIPFTSEAYLPIASCPNGISDGLRSTERYLVAR